MLANVRRSPLAVIAATGYLIGSIPIANLVSRRHGVRDLRDVGDRNPGYWNARETIGVRAADPILAGDVAKGALAATVGTVIGSTAGGPWWSASLGGGAAMVGHAYPVFAGGRGGRSVLTFVGTSIVAAPRASAIAVSTFGAVWAATGRFDHAARVGVAAFPAIQLAVDGPRRTAVSGALMTFVGFRFATAWWNDRRAGPARSATGGAAR